MFSEIEQEHSEVLNEVMEPIEKHKLKIKRKKYEFFKEEWSIIGHYIKNGKIVENSEAKEAF